MVGSFQNCGYFVSECPATAVAILLRRGQGGEIAKTLRHSLEATSRSEHPAGKLADPAFE
jgi:hypothetical protein